MPTCPDKIEVWERKQSSFEKVVKEALISRTRFQLEQEYKVDVSIRGEEIEEIPLLTDHVFQSKRIGEIGDWWVMDRRIETNSDRQSKLWFFQ